MHILLLLLGFYRRISKDLLANYSVTYSAIDTKGINYSYIKILHLAFLHCTGPETDHVTHHIKQQHTRTYGSFYIRDQSQNFNTPDILLEY